MELRRVLLKRLEQLPRIVQDWHLDVRPEDRALLAQDPRLVFDTIYDLIRTTDRVRTIFDALQEPHRSFLFHLAQLGGEVPVSYLVHTTFQGEQGILGQVVSFLAELHLVFVTVGDEVYGDPLPEDVLTHPKAFVGIPDPFLPHLNEFPHLPPSIAVIVKNMTRQERQALLKRLGRTTQHQRDVEQIWELYEALKQRMPTREVVASLSPLAVYLGTLIRLHGRISEDKLVDDVRAKAGFEKHMGQTVSDSAIVAAIDELVECFFCFPGPSDSLFASRELIFPLEWHSHEEIERYFGVEPAEEAAAGEGLGEGLLEPGLLEPDDLDEWDDWDDEEEDDSVEPQFYFGGESLLEWYDPLYDDAGDVGQPASHFAVERLPYGIPQWVLTPPANAPAHVRYREKIELAYQRVRNALEGNQE